jgi:hypothetical protein
MHDIVGLEHFGNYFSDFKEDFIIIGGVATVIQLNQLGFDARVTKDIDMVIVSHPNSDFTSKFTTYIQNGGYKIECNSDGRYSFYRFSEPTDTEFPYQLELFAENFDLLTLQPSQHIIPINKSDIIHNLSAILLDKSYYEMLVKNIDILEGVPVANPSAIMLLKAKAYREILERDGSKRESKKHLNDIMRLSLTLAGNYNGQIEGQIKTDILSIIEVIKKMDKGQVKSVMKGFDTMSGGEIIKVLVDYFGLKKI